MMALKLIVLLSLLLFFSHANSWAGGGPENVFLVVNQYSPESLTVANHYIELRKIPPTNVFYLAYPPLKAATSGPEFTLHVLDPLFKEIEQRKLTNQIDYVVYSTNFPWRVDFGKSFPGETFPREMNPIVSPTSATFLYAFIQHKRKEMMNLGANFYCAPFNPMFVASRGFRSSYRWSLGGRRAGAEGLPYMLSAMLGVTSVPGNTVDEIAWYLKRAAGADGTSPKGTIYYAKNDTIRSTVRDKEFPDAARLVQTTGVRAEIFTGFYPLNKSDIAGVTCGHSLVNPAVSKSIHLPGAFCDNFTSAGGQFLPNKGQTCISEFLRLGAAGACGSIVEPYAIPMKFPNASFNVHYVHGCSLAESYYQSVSAPFQQILIGDPLCQPWAKIPAVKLKGLENKAVLAGKVEFSATAENAEEGVASFRLFIDGSLHEESRPNDSLELDTTTLADGYHEIRVVAVDSTPIETQGRWIGEVTVKNGTDAIQLSINKDSLSPASGQLVLNLFATTAVPAEVYGNGKKLGVVATGTGHLSVGKLKIGSGPITFQAVSTGEPQLRSRPVVAMIPWVKPAAP